MARARARPAPPAAPMLPLGSGQPLPLGAAGDNHLGGNVVQVRRHLPDTGFVVLDVDTLAGRATVAGVLASDKVLVGETVTCTGAWEVHRVFGLRFKASSILVAIPGSREGLLRYFCSGRVRGIGPVLGETLVRAFPGDLIDVIENRPEALRGVPGIGPKRAALIRGSWAEHSAVHHVMIWLQSYGIGTERAYRIWKAYGAKAREKVSENPYRLCLDVQGFGFELADQVARSIGIGADDPMRVRAAVRYALEWAAGEGDCAQTHAWLVGRTSELLAGGAAKSARDGVRQVPPLLVDRGIEAEKQFGGVVEEPLGQGGPFYFLPRLHRAERSVAARLRDLLRGAPPWAGRVGQREMEAAQWRAGRRLSESQARAFRTVLDSKVIVVSGGPGVGKTTIVQMLLDVLGSARLRVVNCAPTGRAARRMGAGAATIHRTLGWQPLEMTFEHNRDKPLSADVVVVDESSMLDVALTRHLLEAVPDHAAVLLVGDADQLPSVGPGNVLHDVIHSGVVPAVFLTEIWRQARDSRIIVNAHRIIRGELPLRAKAGESSDFYWMQADSPEQIEELVLDLVSRRLPAYCGVDPMRDIQVLSPMRKRRLGTLELNIELQRRLNPSSGPAITRHGRTFGAGDRVLQVRNDYHKEVFNGDLGAVVGVDTRAGSLVVEFDGRPLEYRAEELDDLDLAYACTIHKAQGSEYPVVVMPLHAGHFRLLDRNTIYTGVTRARRMLVLVSDQRAVAQAVRTVRSRNRVTLLAERLRQGPPGGKATAVAGQQCAG